MDGARIFNAAVALDRDVKKFTTHVDSLMFCLSKGLSAPIGSMVVGDKLFIERARRIRKLLGGGMRQAGIIAAAGIIALEQMVDRLREDHRNAKILSEELATIEGITINPETVQTNIVLFEVGNLGVDAKQFIARLNVYGVKASNYGGSRVRMVTHRGINREDIKEALRAVEEVVAHVTVN